MRRQNSYSNYDLTATPRILLCFSKEPFLTAQDVWADIYGDLPHGDLPQRMRFREFQPEMITKIVGQDQDTLLAMHLLRHALSLPSGSGAAKSLYDAVARLIPTTGKKRLGAIRFDRGRVLKLYTHLARQCMSSARLALTVKNNEPIVTVLCPDLRTAAMVYGIYEPMAVCPGCGKLFAPSSERNQKFCSTNCGQRIYQKQYRKRERLKKQKGVRKR